MSTQQPGERPPGENLVWSVVGTLLSGPLVWGLVGAGVDRLLDTSAFTPVGIVVGFVASMYIVYVRHGRG